MLLSLALAGGLLALLVVWAELDRETLEATWRRLPFSVYLTALGIHVALYFMRALRFRLLLPVGEKPPLAQVFAVSCAHNLAAFVLPAKTGEVSLVVYLKRLCGVSGPAGLASLLVSRLLDLGLLAGSVGVACLCVQSLDGSELPAWVRPSGALLVTFSIVFFALAMRGDRLVAVYRAIAGVTRFDRTKLGTKVGARAVEVGDALRLAGTRWIGALLLSIPLWIGAYLFYAVLARGFGLPESVTLLEAAFGSGLAMAANLLPINGFAGFGTQEMGWGAGFVALGVSRDLALSTGLGAHLVQLANICLLGVFGHLAMGLFPKREE